MLRVKEARRPRSQHDFYATPRGHVEAALDLVCGTPRQILDPGAGGGPWGSGARQRWPDARITGVEIDPRFLDTRYHAGYNVWLSRDYLTPEPEQWLPPCDLVMGNPPFAQAEAFVRQSLRVLSFGGVCVFLLRLAFLESKGRAGGLFTEHPPEVVSVCAGRPRFYDNKTGADAFAVYLWRKNWRGETRLTWSDIGKGGDE